MAIDVRWYSGHTPCPECGLQYDPESGFCERCDPVLWQVWAVDQAWFDDENRQAWSAVVSTRNLGAKVAEFSDGAVFVGAQRVEV